MDIVEFAEKVCNIELLESQKILLRKLSSLPEGSRIIYGFDGRYHVVPKDSIKTKKKELT